MEKFREDNKQGQEYINQDLSGLRSHARANFFIETKKSRAAALHKPVITTLCKPVRTYTTHVAKRELLVKENYYILHTRAWLFTSSISGIQDTLPASPWAVTLLLCYTVTLSLCYIITLLHCYIVTLLHYYFVTLLHCYSVSVSLSGCPFALLFVYPAFRLSFNVTALVLILARI